MEPTSETHRPLRIEDAALGDEVIQVWGLPGELKYTRQRITRATSTCLYTGWRRYDRRGEGAGPLTGRLAGWGGPEGELVRRQEELERLAQEDREHRARVVERQRAVTALEWLEANWRSVGRLLDQQAGVIIYDLLLARGLVNRIE